MSLDPLAAALIAVEESADLLRGPEGPQGPQGEPGADGADGRDGQPGPQGEPGQDGRDGKDGADGKDGKDGRPGPQGIEGPEGVRGPKGDKGKQGDPGPAGGSVGRSNMAWVPTATPPLSGVLAVGSDAGAHAITGLADPTNAQDAATKAYVDANAGGGSGFTPVSCVLQASDQDIASTDPYYVLWGAANITDDWADQNTLEALPDGIGLDLNSDNLTTNVAGVWALTMAYVIPTDLTWGGDVDLTNFAGPIRAHHVQYTADDPPVLVVPGAKYDALSLVLYLPSGAQIATKFTTSDAATGATLMASAQLTIVRLA